MDKITVVVSNVLVGVCVCDIERESLHEHLEEKFPFAFVNMIK